MSKKKKFIVLSCMVALLAVTAVFNFVFSTDRSSQGDAVLTSAGNYFTQYRSERITTRNEELLQLDEIISIAAEGSVERNDALAMKIDLTANTEKEMMLENLIKAYGFEDAVVMIGSESDNVNVMAKSAELTADDAVIIYSIIKEELSVSPENVKIIPIS